MSSPTLEEGKNLDIEVLRGCAITMTLVQHAEVLIHWADSPYWRLRQHFGLWTGVDLFFVISGFVITQSLMRTCPGSGERLLAHPAGAWAAIVSFWIRRAWRLWPAAWLWAVAWLLCALIFNRSGVFGDPSRLAADVAAAVLQLANVHWAGCYHAVPESLARCNVVEATQIQTVLPTGWGLLTYWSLSLEEQFYLVLPLLLWVLPRRWLAAGLVLAVIAQAPLARSPLAPVWFFRTDALLLGVALAWAMATRAGRAAPAGPSRRVLAWLVLAGILSAMAWLGAAPRAGLNGSVALIAVLAAAAVAMAARGQELWLPSHGRCFACGAWLGSRSYSLYLTHLLAYFMLRELAFRLGWNPAASNGAAWLYCGAALALVVLLAELSHRWIEDPLRRHGRDVAQRWLLRRRLAARG